MNRMEMVLKVRNYTTESRQRLEVFTDIEICNEEDNETAHDLMDKRLEEMTDVELENMCNRIDHEDDYGTYYEILG